MIFALFFAAPAHVPAQDTLAGDQMLAEYFRAETAKLADRCLADIETLEDWTSKRDEYRRQLAEMLGLDPMPERTDLKAVVTGNLENEFFTVEMVQFQSRPGLYVTGNLYLPKGLDEPAPAVLYVCGHGQVKKDGVSYGNKTSYQHHGEWLARNGFVCLTIDTIQLGEIEGLHHGTYREGMWWWNSRGYTPAGVEAFNGIRALDYLQSRPEVDGEKLGVAGRSGGGAYSWWIAALDERVKAAVPTAGITDLENHVVDGCVEGHCDCMFMVNTYRWDYPQVAALVAPRALLIANTDKDSIFPLDGVERVHRKVREIYRLYDAEKQLGLQISEGPHKDIQELQVAEFHWFNRFLKGEDAPVENTGIKYFEPEQLKVLESLPADEITSRIHETFVPAAEPPNIPENQEEWARMRDGWMKALKEKCFAGWPEEPGPLNVEKVFTAVREGIVDELYSFDSQPGVRLSVFIQRAANASRAKTVLFRLRMRGVTKRPAEDDESSGKRQDGDEIAGADSRIIASMFFPREISGSEKQHIHNRRRFMLLGQTLAGMQVWDTRRAIQAIRSIEAFRGSRIEIEADGDIALLALYASLFEPTPTRLSLANLPRTHRDGPDFLNVLRYLDVPQTLAMAAERGDVILARPRADGWEFPVGVARQLKWTTLLRIIELASDEAQSEASGAN
ncbi:MAG TPA: prolyl oligopeptidase family serine peptidase [Pirellulales bacterium]|nr:prolyl oligopeptidase family serine peptidase [Pirellulales bacterium]